MPVDPEQVEAALKWAECVAEPFMRPVDAWIREAQKHVPVLAQALRESEAECARLRAELEECRQRKEVSEDHAEAYMAEVKSLRAENKQLQEKFGRGELAHYECIKLLARVRKILYALDGKEEGHGT